MIVASREAKYSTLRDNELICFMRVISTPHGIGQPMNLWPETLTLPIGFLKVTFGASCTSPENGLFRVYRKSQVPFKKME
jgi:hypothetical protein